MGANRLFTIMIRFLVVVGAAVACAALWPGNASVAQTGGGLSGATEVQTLLVPNIESTLSSQTTFRIDQINRLEGERFEAGEPLIVFDCDVLRAEGNTAKAVLKGARDLLDSRYRLRDLRGMSDIEVALAEAEFLRAEAELARAKALLKRCHIDVPFGGVVVELLVNQHESVQEGQPLLRVVDNSMPRVEMFVPSRWIAWLKPGMDFEISVNETSKVYAATITILVPRIDAVSQTFKAIGKITGDHLELIPGMSGTAIFHPPEIQ